MNYCSSLLLTTAGRGRPDPARTTHWTVLLPLLTLLPWPGRTLGAVLRLDASLPATGNRAGSAFGDQMHSIDGATGLPVRHAQTTPVFIKALKGARAALQTESTAL